MRFRVEETLDGSKTVFDAEAGESYKSRHAANTETEAVFFTPGIRENPHLHHVHSFRILELGFGLGTNLFHAQNACQDYPSQSFQYTSIDRDLAGAQYYLKNLEENPSLKQILEQKTIRLNNFNANLLVGDFTEILEKWPKESLFHAIFFDPFSPKANPESWSTKLFSLCTSLMENKGRLVTYSVSRPAKEACLAAGLGIEKRELPQILHKRNSLLAYKP